MTRTHRPDTQQTDMTHTGRIDVHAHLLPGIDDGCKNLAESVACARAMVDAGYTHLFCTPHIWPGNDDIHVGSIGEYVAQLQTTLDTEGVALKLIPGGEINLTPTYTRSTKPRDVVTYGLVGRYAIFDIWVERLPDFFEPSVRWFRSLGIQPILAHPERMRAVQDDPMLVDKLQEMGLLLQGNLQCISDPPNSLTNRTAMRFLDEDRYFMLGSDLHNLQSLPCRLEGLRLARQIVGDAKFDELTITHPLKLLDGVKL